MKSIVRTAIFVLTMLFGAVVGMSQEFGAGLKITRTTNVQPDTSLGLYGEAALKLPKGFQARILGEYSEAAELPTIFTRDDNEVVQSNRELRIRPALRKGVVSILFLEVGADLFRQEFEGPAASDHDQSRVGLNPLATAGVRFGGYEGAYSYIFKDPGYWNNAGLQGHRVGFSYRVKTNKGFGLKFGAEAETVEFNEEHKRHRDYYREYDFILKFRAGFTFGGGYKK